MNHSIASVLKAAIGTLCMAGSVDAEIVQVDVYGIVIFNGTSGLPLSSVAVGETAHTSFTVDSSVFVDSIPGTVRAYDVMPASFTLSFSGGASVGLGVGPAYFAVRNNDPAVDGFFLSDSTSSFGGLFLSQAPYREDFHATYGGGLLSSVDILAATGTYNFTGLTVFGYNLWQAFPDNIRMDIDFDHMTITANSPADLDGDGDVDGFDLALLLGAWGRCPKPGAPGSCPADLDDNGIVNGFDLALLLGAWG